MTFFFFKFGTANSVWCGRGGKFLSCIEEAVLVGVLVVRGFFCKFCMLAKNVLVLLYSIEKV